MLGLADIGHRVVVRRVVGVHAGRPQFTDALGVLTSVTATELTLETETGPLVITRAAVVAGKRVPPRPARRPPGPPPTSGPAD